MWECRVPPLGDLLDDSGYGNDSFGSKADSQDLSSLSSDQSLGLRCSEASWPRVRSPACSRRSVLARPLPPAINSPPFLKALPRRSPLRTPSSQPAIDSMQKPSPYRSFSSPSYTTRVLRLSNTENVIGVRFCEDSLKKGHGAVSLESIPKLLEEQEKQQNKAARCLTLPSCSSSDRLDEVNADILETPSKCLTQVDDMDTLSSPLRRLFPDHLYDVDAPLAELYPDEGLFPIDTPTPTKTSPPTPSSFRKAMEQVQRLGHLVPRQILEPTSCEPSTSAMAFADPASKKRKLSDENLFKEPLKFPEPFSREWMTIATGQTEDQLTVTTAARAFLARRDVGVSVQHRIGHEHISSQTMHLPNAAAVW